MEKKILLFHVEKEKRQQIEILCASQGIVPVAVERKQYGDPLGSLVGIPGLKKRGKGYRGRSFPGEMLVFFGLDSDALDLFLDGYRQAGIAAYPHQRGHDALQHGLERGAAVQRAVGRTQKDAGIRRGTKKWKSARW